jgi:hypothetical protein
LIIIGCIVPADPGGGGLIWGFNLGAVRESTTVLLDLVDCAAHDVAAIEAAKAIVVITITERISRFITPPSIKIIAMLHLLFPA